MPTVVSAEKSVDGPIRGVRVVGIIGYKGKNQAGCQGEGRGCVGDAGVVDGAPSAQEQMA